MTKPLQRELSGIVLVVDPSASMRAFTAQRLTGLGWRTLVAANARETIDYLERFGAPDLILADCRLPGNECCEFVRTIRSNHDFDSIKLMMVAAPCDVLRLPELLGAGADAFLFKPFDRETIIAKLTTLGVMPTHRSPRRGESTCEL